MRHCSGQISQLSDSPWIYQSDNFLKLPQLGIHLGAGIVSSIIVATIGAIILLVILRLVNRGGRW